MCVSCVLHCVLVSLWCSCHVCVLCFTLCAGECLVVLCGAACNLCFAEKSIYTQEVLAVVMQQLMDMNPLPTLLMRTVIQSLAMYPKLIGFVMNIMQRLIIKQASVLFSLRMLKCPRLLYD